MVTQQFLYGNVTLYCMQYTVHLGCNFLLSMNLWIK